ncbi:MAG: FAD-dependent oxidoreductase [Arenicellales bacterium]|nr:FAD-dependent oxidoreductase [Arenicellales bacterium]
MAVYDINRILMPDAPSEYVDDTGQGHYVPAPCQVACPVGTDAPSYIAYIWEQKFEQAFEAITATNPFSSICGRVCDAPCEPACRRTDSDGPVQIRNLKRYVMDKLGATWTPDACPVTRKQSVGIVGAGPAGLVAAHDLSTAGFKVDVYEMSDRPGGMMVWGIPAFRLPPGIIDEDIDRLHQKCPGLDIHLNTALGRDIKLNELKERHDAVLLCIGAWWGKAMGVPGEQDERVVDGVGFLRRVNAGERPQLPHTVVVVGGGDVAMDACRVAKRLPDCEHVIVVYRRGPKEIPARAIELKGAVDEGIEFLYNTQQVAVEANGKGLSLKCVRTDLGEPDEDGRRRPVPIAGSEHSIGCGMVIAAVGQQGENDELDHLGMMLKDRVKTEWETMRTKDPKVFAAGDGAFGGSTIVMAMHHGQRAAYYIKHYLEGNDHPLPYRTPYRTRRVPVAQDLQWELLPEQHPKFFGLGDNPIQFPEIEETYSRETALKEAARCYRCDAETGSADYSVQQREHIFSMARTNPLDAAKNHAMLSCLLEVRENPVPDNKPASLDDIVFLPANLSRLVIDPYREACKVDTEVGRGLPISHPLLVTGFDSTPVEVRQAVAEGLKVVDSPYVGQQPLSDDGRWWQLLTRATPPSHKAEVVLYSAHDLPASINAARPYSGQLVGIYVSDPMDVPKAVQNGLDQALDVLLLDGSGSITTPWAELKGAPDFSLLRDAIALLRKLDREEEIDLVWFGGIRSGTDAAKILGLGTVAVVQGTAIGIAAGGEIQNESLVFNSDLNEDDRSTAVINLIKANIGEASMMARCTGKTVLYNIEPEDLRAITLVTSKLTGIPIVGTGNSSVTELI